MQAKLVSVRKHTSCPAATSRLARNWPKVPKPTTPMRSLLCRSKSIFALCSKSKGMAASSAHTRSAAARTALPETPRRPLSDNVDRRRGFVRAAQTHGEARLCAAHASGAGCRERRLHRAALVRMLSALGAGGVVSADSHAPLEVVLTRALPQEGCGGALRLPQQQVLRRAARAARPHCVRKLSLLLRVCLDSQDPLVCCGCSAPRRRSMRSVAHAGVPSSERALAAR